MPLVKQNLMKLEVFILGGQRIDQKRKKGWCRERIEIERRDIKAIASDVLIRSEVMDVTKVANN